MSPYGKSSISSLAFTPSLAIRQCKEAFAVSSPLHTPFSHVTRRKCFSRLFKILRQETTFATETGLEGPSLPFLFVAYESSAVMEIIYMAKVSFLAKITTFRPYVSFRRIPIPTVSTP